MACSKHELGYEDDRFEIVVSQRFHCPICFLVLKDPVMCKNHHVFCSSCIKKHLENSQTCPTCREHLSVETLNKAPNIVTDYILELNIRCDFYSRGCPEMVQVGNLKRHVASCGFSPVQCSNEGCDAVVNVRDKLHHEAEVCDFRKLKYHDSSQLVSEVKDLMCRMLAGQDQMKEEIKAEMKNEIQGMGEEIKMQVKGEMNEMREEMQNKIEGMKAEIKVELMAEMKEVKNEMKVFKNEVKQETKGIKSGMKGMKEEVKVEVKGEMKEVKNEMKVMKNEIKQETSGIKSGMKGMNEEMKVLKNEIKQETNGIKSAMKAMKNDLKNEMSAMKSATKETKDEIKGMKGEIKGNMDNMNGIRDGMRNEIEGIKEEIKVVMREDINIMKAEMKSEIKEIVMNAIQSTMEEIRGSMVD